MSTLTTHTTATRATPSNSNVGLCKFNTTNKAIEVSDGSDWVIYNYDSIIAPGIANSYSLSLDGSNDQLVAGNVSQLSGTVISISAWFNLSATPSSDAIIGAAVSGGRRFWMQVLNTTTIRFANIGTVNTFSLSSGTFNTNTWYHVVGVINGTSKEVFVNGSSLGTATTQSPSGSNGDNLTIGNLPTIAFGSNPFAGLIDEVAVFNSALSSSDVTTIYNNGTPTDISTFSPVGWWRMGDNDSGTGTTVTDQGSGGNDGTLQNGASFSTTVPS
jgi:hypothetical protein